MSEHSFFFNYTKRKAAEKGTRTHVLCGLASDQLSTDFHPTRPFCSSEGHVSFTTSHSVWPIPERGSLESAQRSSGSTRVIKTWHEEEGCSPGVRSEWRGQWRERHTGAGIGSEAEMSLLTPASHAGVSASSPGSTSDHNFLLMCTLGRQDCGSSTWFLPYTWETWN